MKFPRTKRLWNENLWPYALAINRKIGEVEEGTELYYSCNESLIWNQAELGLGRALWLLYKKPVDAFLTPWADQSLDIVTGVGVALFQFSYESGKPVLLAAAEGMITLV
jgi:hypothetical protein